GDGQREKPVSGQSVGLSIVNQSGEWRVSRTSTYCITESVEYNEVLARKVQPFEAAMSVPGTFPKLYGKPQAEEDCITPTPSRLEAYRLLILYCRRDMATVRSSGMKYWIGVTSNEWFAFLSAR